MIRYSFVVFWFFVVVFAYYLFLCFLKGITRSATCLVGKTALITGANSGLGYQAALNLASRGCRIIMADVADMENSKNDIIKYTGNPNIVTKHLDLSSLKSVRDFAEDINKTEERLHILLNNAGIGLSSENRTKDGLHPVMQINYFGHFLLTHLLINLLKKSTPSRIVNTSSGMAFINNLTVENLNFNDKGGALYKKVCSYSNSKLAILMASDVFAERLAGSGVTSNSLNPGFVSTAIFAKSSSAAKNPLATFLMSLYNWIFAKDAWEGSQVLVHVAVSKKVGNLSGKFFWDCRSFFKPWKAHNKDFRKKIWEASEKFVDLSPEEKLL